jgi:hypothetical protein
MASLWKLRQIAKRHRITLVHCNEQDVYPIGQYLARWLGVPVVVSIHCSMARPYCEWAFGGRRCPDRIFFISPGNLETCRASVDGVIPESRRRVLFNGLDLNHYQPSEERRLSFRRRFSEGSPGSLAHCAKRQATRAFVELGLRLSIRAANRRGWRLVAGASHGSREAVLKHAHEALGTDSSTSDIPTSCDFTVVSTFVNTSREELRISSVLESTSRGCPVVALSNPWTGRFSGEAKSCRRMMIAPTNAVERWIGSPERLQQSRAGARARVRRTDNRKLSGQLWEEYHLSTSETKWNTLPFQSTLRN